MTQNYHTDIPFGAARSSAVINSPLGQLDAQITALTAASSGWWTTLDGTAASGQKVIPCTSTTGAVVGMPFWLGPLNGTHETGTIASIQAGVSITAATNLTSTYAAGAICAMSIPEVADARGTFTSLGARMSDVATRTIGRATRRADTVDVAVNGSPLLIAHRGASRSHPENTVAAFQAAISLGAKAIEFDVHFDAYDQPVVLHDDALDRTATGASGNVNLFSAAALRSLDNGTKYATSFSGEGVVGLAEIFERFGGRCMMIIEIKVAASDGSLSTAENIVADMIHEYGLDAYCIIAHLGSLGGSTKGWTSYGIPYLLYTGTIAADGTVSAISPASWISSGWKYVGVQIGAANFDAGINAWVSAGAKALAWTVENRYQRSTAIATTGVTALLCSDLPYNQPILTPLGVGVSLPFVGPSIPRGASLYKYGTARDIILQPGSDGFACGIGGADRCGWAVYGGSAYAECVVLGQIRGGNSGIGKLSASIKLEATATDTTRFGGLGWYTDDRGHTTTAGADTATGYFGILRASGTIDLFRVDATGAEVSLGTDATGAALGVGSSYTATLEITASQVIFAANGKTITANDATYRANGLVAALHRNRAAVSFTTINRVS